MYSQNLAERLKKARQMTGFTQIEVERETGIKQNSLTRYETGTREPDVETIGTLADFYGVSVDWLFGFVTKGNRPNYDQTPKQKKAI